MHIFSQLTKIALILIATIVIQACTTSAKINNPTVVTPETMQQWKASGKISIKVNKKNTNANFTWENNYSHYTINLFGPMGFGGASLNKNDDGVTLKTSKGVFTADTGEELLRKHLNIALPINEMHSWIKGLPDPNLPLESDWQKDDIGNITNMQQSSWIINFSKYAYVKGLDENNRKAQLPFKLSFKADNEHSTNKSLPLIKILMVVKQWRI